MMNCNFISHHPLVSVIVPAYNAAKYLAQNIESVLRQTYRNFELLVVDDGSTDDTAEVVARYGDRVIYFRKPNGGGASARNYGIARSRGEFIAPLDADDYWLPGKLERTMAVFEKTAADVVFTACTYVDDDGRRLFDYFPRFRKHHLYNDLLLRNFIPNGTVLMRRKIVESIGGYDERIFIPNDWDLWLRLAEVCRIEYLPEPLTCYRRAASSISLDVERQHREQLMVVDKVERRNRLLPKEALTRARASLYYKLGYSTLRIGESRRAFRSLIASLRIYSRDWKTWALLGMLLSGAHRIKTLRLHLLR
jgi:glycosyltransferase involved in cell wall biosynthesis